MPQRKRKKEKDKKDKAKRPKKGRKKRFKLDVEAVSKEIGEEIVRRLGLDLIEITANDILDIIENIVSEIAENRVTKPSNKSIIKRILASKDNFRKAVAVRLFELKQENLTLEQLEFIVSYAPELAGKATPVLYKIAKKYNAEYVISSLQTLWNKYGKRTPLRCPRCGFYSVTPDLTCMVCGAILDEEEIRKSINLIEKLREFSRHAPTPLLREIYQAGFVILNDEIHPPSTAPRKGFRVELHLKPNERVIIINELKARDEL